MAAVSSSAEYNRMKEVKEFDETKIGVKGLVDSGITAIPKFFIQTPEIRSTLKPCPKDAGIPLIDLSQINSPDHRPRIVDELREAAKSWGFFQVINHGVPVSVLNRTIESIKSFHEQPQDVKAKHYGRTEVRGVMYASNNDLLRSKGAASWHDFVHVCMSPEPAELDQIPEVCRSEIVAWDKEATMVAETVAELLSQGLGLPAGKLKEAGLLVSKSIAGTYYPFCPQQDLTLGLNHHTDPGVLTVLLENQVVGLQVKHGGEWVDVKPVPASLIINIGDALQIISNGEYISVEHRVLANSLNQPRISVVEFFILDARVESRHYGPLPELITPETPAQFRSFTVKEFHDNFFTKGLDSKSLVQKLKV